MRIASAHARATGIAVCLSHRAVRYNDDSWLSQDGRPLHPVELGEDRGTFVAEGIDDGSAACCSKVVELRARAVEVCVVIKRGQSLKQFLGWAVEERDQMRRSEKPMLGGVADHGQVVGAQTDRRRRVAMKMRALGRGRLQQIEDGRGG